MLAPGHAAARAAGLEQRLGADEELVAGRRPVEEAFVARRGAVRLLVVPQRRQALERIVLHATNLRIPIVEVEGGTLTALAGFDGHQGIGLVVRPRVWATIDAVLARAAERAEPPFVLVLDSLEDPQNFGTLLRSAEAAGVHGVIFPTHHQAPLSPAAVKASAGATEHLLLVPVDDLAASLADLHVRGLRVAGSEADAPLTVRQADLRGPLALVVGSEGQGLGPAIRRRCDMLLRIPMRGAIGSLNASVAGSILLFEALEQRGLPAPSADAEVAVPAAEPSAGPAGPAEGAAPVLSTEPSDGLVEAAVGPETGARTRRRAKRAMVPEEPAATAAGPVPGPASAPRTRRKANAAAAGSPPADEAAERASLADGYAQAAGAAALEELEAAEPNGAAVTPSARVRAGSVRRRPKADASPVNADAAQSQDESGAAAPVAGLGATEDLLPGTSRARRRSEPRP